MDDYFIYLILKQIFHFALLVNYQIILIIHIQFFENLFYFRKK